MIKDLIQALKETTRAKRVFLVFVIIGYVIALKSIEKTLETHITLVQMNYILLSIGIVVASISMILITCLVITRNKLTKFFYDNNINL